jgi:hypothetical protein
MVLETDWKSLYLPPVCSTYRTVDNSHLGGCIAPLAQAGGHQTICVNHLHLPHRNLSPRGPLHTGGQAAYVLPDVIILWLCAFLTDRRQRVAIGEVFFGWQLVHAVMAPGTYLDLVTFTILTDSLQSACLTHEFVDDNTLTEILDREANKRMQHSNNELLEWSRHNLVIKNER